jgi:hypothetical protein
MTRLLATLLLFAAALTCHAQIQVSHIKFAVSIDGTDDSYTSIHLFGPNGEDTRIDGSAVNGIHTFQVPDGNLKGYVEFTRGGGIHNFAVHVAPGQTVDLGTLGYDLAVLSINVKQGADTPEYVLRGFDERGDKVFQTVELGGWERGLLPAGRFTIRCFRADDGTFIDEFPVDLKKGEVLKKSVQTDPEWAKQPFWKRMVDQAHLGDKKTKHGVQFWITWTWLFCVILINPIWLFLSFAVTGYEKARGITRSLHINWTMMLICYLPNLALGVYYVYNKSKGFEWSSDFFASMIFPAGLFLTLLSFFPACRKRVPRNLEDPGVEFSGGGLFNLIRRTATEYSYTVTVDKNTGAVLSDGQATSMAAHGFLAAVICLLLVAVFPIYITWLFLRNYIFPLIGDALLAFLGLFSRRSAKA